MRNITLVLFLFFVSFRVLPQGSYCSRNTGVPNNEEKSDLSNKIEKSTSIVEFILNLNRTMREHYDEIEKRHKELIEKLDCMVKPGFCSIFAVEVFGYFQDGVFDDVDLESTIGITHKGLTTPQISDYLKEYYSSHTTIIEISSNLSAHTEAYLDLKIGEHLNADGKHGILTFSFKKYSNDIVYGHSINVFRLNNKIYYIHDDKPLASSITPILSRRGSGIDRVTLVELVYIKP